MLSVTAMKAFANTLLNDNTKKVAYRTAVGRRAAPTLGQVLGNEPHLEEQEGSRLPLRA